MLGLVRAAHAAGIPATPFDVLRVRDDLLYAGRAASAAEIQLAIEVRDGLGLLRVSDGVVLPNAPIILPVRDGLMDIDEVNVYSFRRDGYTSESEDERGTRVSSHLVREVVRAATPAETAQYRAVVETVTSTRLAAAALALDRERIYARFLRGEEVSVFTRSSRTWRLRLSSFRSVQLPP